MASFQIAMNESYSLDEIFDIEFKLVFLVGKSGTGNTAYHLNNFKIKKDLYFEVKQASFETSWCPGLPQGPPFSYRPRTGETLLHWMESLFQATLLIYARLIWNRCLLAPSFSLMITRENGEVIIRWISSTASLTFTSGNTMYKY